MQHCYCDIHHDVTTHKMTQWLNDSKPEHEHRNESGGGVWMQRAIMAVGHRCFQWCHFPLHYCLYNRNMEAGGHEPLYALYTTSHCLASGYWNHFNKTTGTGKHTRAAPGTATSHLSAHPNRHSRHVIVFPSWSAKFTPHQTRDETVTQWLKCLTTVTF